MRTKSRKDANTQTRKEITATIRDLKAQIPRRRGEANWAITHGDDAYHAWIGACMGNITLIHEDPVKLLAAIMAAEIMLTMRVSAEIALDF